MTFKDSFNQMNKNISAFFTFIGGKLKNFPSLTRGEQVSYIAIGAGIILILMSVVLFVV